MQPHIHQVKKKPLIWIRDSFTASFQALLNLVSSPWTVFSSYLATFVFFVQFCTTFYTSNKQTNQVGGLFYFISGSFQVSGGLGSRQNWEYIRPLLKRFKFSNGLSVSNLETFSRSFLKCSHSNEIYWAVHVVSFVSVCYAMYEVLIYDQNER